MKQSIPVEIHETQYSLVSYGFQSTEFECDHIHHHKELLTGEMFEREGLSEYKVSAYVCDNCEEVLENEYVEECNV